MNLFLTIAFEDQNEEIGLVAQTGLIAVAGECPYLPKVYESQDLSLGEDE